MPAAAYLILRLEAGVGCPKIDQFEHLFIPGLVIGLAGLALFITRMCVRMVILIGEGTIMPWDPTRGSSPAACTAT